MIGSVKRAIPLLAMALFLTACGGSSKGTAVVCQRAYWDGTVGVCLPTGWSVLDKQTLAQRGAPAETVAAFTADVASSGQFPTIVVIQEPLTQVVSAQDYGAANIRSVSTLPGYAILDDAQATIDGEKVTLHIFTAQPVNDEPARRFYQLSTVHGNNGYTVNASAPVAVSDELENQILAIVQSATFTAPVAPATGE